LLSVKVQNLLFYAIHILLVCTNNASICSRSDLLSNFRTQCGLRVKVAHPWF